MEHNAIFNVSNWNRFEIAYLWLNGWTILFVFCHPSEWLIASGANEIALNSWIAKDSEQSEEENVIQKVWVEKLLMMECNGFALVSHWQFECGRLTIAPLCYVFVVVIVFPLILSSNGVLYTQTHTFYSPWPCDVLPTNGV